MRVGGRQGAATCSQGFGPQAVCGDSFYTHEGAAHSWFVFREGEPGNGTKTSPISISPNAIMTPAVFCNETESTRWCRPRDGQKNHNTRFSASLWTTSVWTINVDTQSTLPCSDGTAKTEGYISTGVTVIQRNTKSEGLSKCVCTTLSHPLWSAPKKPALIFQL